MLKIPSKFRVPLSVFVKETFPSFLVSDGYYFTSLYFSQEALAEHR
jgi:hypothetical protein